MGNQHSGAHATLRPRKNVHWKTAGRPAAPGRPDIAPLLADDEPHAVTLRWPPAPHDGGAPLLGYQVECNRVGSAEWIRTQPPLVQRAELVLSGLEPPHRYQFRVAAVNAVGRSEYGELSDVLCVSEERAAQQPPAFLQHLRDATALENDAAEFRVSFAGAPAPTVAWFKDDYEIFSSRRTAITSTDTSSVLLFHQTLASDEGEIKCTATNRAGHAVTRARLSIEAAPKLRYPRQYEDGLLYEINETIFLKTTIVGKPAPTVEWRHDGNRVVPSERVELVSSGKFSALKIHAARRSDRGEYAVTARNAIGEDSAAFLVTVTAPPEPPRRVAVARQVDKSVTLDWEPPEDDGGCRVGNYVVEYFRTGWNVWLKATTSRQTSVTLFDLIEGSEYRFRVKAESPYGMSAPSAESAPVRIPGRAVDMDFLAVEARIISDELTRVEGEAPRVSPAPRRRRAPPSPSPPPPARTPAPAQPQRAHSNEFMLVLYPENQQQPTDNAEKRKSFQLDLEEALSPPPLSLSAPELRALAGEAAGAAGGARLRHAVSSTELLHERAMARFYRAVELERQHAHRERAPSPAPPRAPAAAAAAPPPPRPPPPDIYIKTDSLEGRQYKYESRQSSHDSQPSDRWATSFDEDYTASTVSTDGEYSDEEGGGASDADRVRSDDEVTYSPRDKLPRAEPEPLKPLPLPDPNFVPKPILKRREPELPDSKIPLDNGVLTTEQIPKVEEKPKTERKKEEKSKSGGEKIPFYKKFTKMPVQKPFPFPKILKRAEPESPEPPEVPEEAPKPNKKTEKENKISEEGRTVIDYYGNIVKEYGGQKKSAPPLYLNTEELKTVAERQAAGAGDDMPAKKNVKKKGAAPRKTNTNKTPAGKNKLVNSNENPKKKEIPKSDGENKGTREVVLRSAERATIVIPIDYEALERRAKAQVRGAIDCAVDVCLLAVAFYLYLFRDERLAVPPLALALYRQLRDAARRAPAWLRAHRPAPPAAWLFKRPDAN